jgi:hypothetical protein
VIGFQTFEPSICSPLFRHQPPTIASVNRGVGSAGIATSLTDFFKTAREPRCDGFEFMSFCDIAAGGQDGR